MEPVRRARDRGRVKLREHLKSLRHWL
jgi:hypothetical protein